MAIYTRTGRAVKIVDAKRDRRGVWVMCRDANDNPDHPEREFALSDLRADDGFAEIAHAVEDVAPGIRNES